MIHIYDNILKIAKAKGLSISFIEKETGLACGSLCKWNRVSPSVRSLKKVADFLGCTINELINDNTKTSVQ